MKKPFFFRYLEAQEMETVSGGKKFHTLKFPSDDDECVTMKWPSDDDEYPVEF